MQKINDNGNYRAINTLVIVITVFFGFPEVPFGTDKFESGIRRKRGWWGLIWWREAMRSKSWYCWKWKVGMNIHLQWHHAIEDSNSELPLTPETGTGTQGHRVFLILCHLLRVSCSTNSSHVALVLGFKVHTTSTTIRIDDNFWSLTKILIFQPVIRLKKKYTKKKCLFIYILL